MPTRVQWSPFRLCLHVLGLLLVASCAAEGTGSPPAAPAQQPGTPSQTSAVLTGPPQSLRLHGSNTIGLSIAPPLAKAFLEHAGATNIKVDGDDRKSERIWVQGALNGRWTSIEVYAPGSKVAFASLGSGDCDIGLASRQAKQEEIDSLRALGDLTSPSADHVIGIDGIAIIVNKNNRLARINTKQLASVFAGELTDWAQFGAPPAPIHVYTRDAKSGTHDAFASIVMGSKTERSDAKTFNDSEALSAAVSADPAGIGYVGLPFVKDAKAVAVQDGDATPLYPTVFTISTEDYALSRRLHLYTAETPKNPLTKQFVDFAMSEEGQHIVEQAGFVSLEVRAENAAPPTGAPSGYESDVKGASRLSVDFRFRTGSSQLDTKALPDVDRVLKFLSQPENRAKRVMLHGFADSQGAEKVNVELSRTRADAVAKELRQRGVALDKASGWGSAMPIAPNDSVEGRERNRRVEIWVR